MSGQDMELMKIVKGFRVSELQALLTYAGRNKGGKKNELQARALELVKLNSQPIILKIRELHMSRYQQTRGHTESSDMYPLAPLNETIGNTYGSASSRQANVGNVGLTGYVPSLTNKPMMRTVTNLNVVPPYAVNPDVKFKELPFYDVISEIMRPTSLVPLGNERLQERDLAFYLTPQQLMELDSNSDIQVQLRICLLETSCEQEDELPGTIVLKVNSKVANLPAIIPAQKQQVEPKRYRRPVDITNIVRRTVSEANEVNISWASINGRPFALAVFLVRKLSAGSLIRRLKDNGVRNPDHTTAMIKEKLNQDRDSEIATMSLRGSLMCPLGKIKMKLPCRALTCTHLQCFDATLYVQMNEKKPKWICPVCDKPAFFKSLAIDGLFLNIISKAPSECTEVQFHEDGSWTPVLPVKKIEVSDATIESVPKKDVPKPKKSVEVISLESDSDTEDSWPLAPPKKKLCRPVGIISPMLLESPENSQSPESAVEKPFDPLAPCSSKSDPATFKTSSGPSEKSSAVSQPFLESDVSCIHPAASPVISLPNSPGYSPPSSSPTQTFCSTSSNMPTTSTFHDPLELLNSGPSSSSDQCQFSNFDLYTLIQQNQGESFHFPSNLEEEIAPDIISID